MWRVGSSKRKCNQKIVAVSGVISGQVVCKIWGRQFQTIGRLSEVVFLKIDFSNVEPEISEWKIKSGLNNGHLAMIAIALFVSAPNIPGSVPALKNVAAF